MGGEFALLVSRNGSAEEMTCKLDRSSLAFTVLIKKMGSGEGTRPAPATKAQVREESDVDSVLSSTASSQVVNHTGPGQAGH